MAKSEFDSFITILDRDKSPYDVKSNGRANGHATGEWRKSSNVAVIGAGYVGLVTAACLSSLGHDVVCVDKDPERLSILANGEVPFHEPGLDELVAHYWQKGRLSFTSDYAVALDRADVVMIAVNTPASDDGRLETAYVFAAAREVLEHARPGIVVAIKSTVPIGTGDEVAALVGDSAAPGIEIVSNPEFLRQGTAIEDFLKPDRIVVGGSDAEAVGLVAGLYQGLSAPMILCNRRSAELAKPAANAFLAARLSLINEIAVICDAAEADITEVSRIIGSDYRIGTHYLQAGLGWGGSCLPKDVPGLAAVATAYGCSPLILDAIIRVNARIPERVISNLRDVAALSAGSTVGILGLSFKPDTDDVRSAPALGIIPRLLECGFNIRAHDPQAMKHVRPLFPEITFCSDPYELAEGCDALFLVTEWREYLELDWVRIRELMHGHTILDGRNVLDREALVGAGFNWLSPGRGTRLAKEYPAVAVGSHSA